MPSDRPVLAQQHADVGLAELLEDLLHNGALHDIELHIGDRGAIAQFDRGVEQVAHVVDSAPHLRHAAVHVEQRVHGLHAGAHRVFGSEDRVARRLGELAEEREVHGAIRHHVRPITGRTRHEERGDVRHHGRNADSTVFCHIVDLIYRNTQVVQPLSGNFLTGTILHRFFDIITGNIGKQSVNPYADFLRILFLELSLTVDGPA